MITWLRENAALASVLAGFIAFISGGAVAFYRLNSLDAAQPGIQNHVHDTTRHIDPNRDPQALKSLEERVEKLEEQSRRTEGRWRSRGIRIPEKSRRGRR